LKQFLRELRDPLLTFDLYELFLEAGREGILNQVLKSLQSRHMHRAYQLTEHFMIPVEAVQKVVARLPADNRRVLKYLLAFLADVAAHSASNKMPMHNLATGALTYCLM